MPSLRQGGRRIILWGMWVAAVVPWAATTADTIKVGKERKQTIGRVISLNAGDVACYVGLVDDRGRQFDEMADFEVCEQDLLGRRVLLNYGIAKVLAPICRGNPDCPKTVKLAVIFTATVIDPMETPHPTEQAREAQAQAMAAKASEHFNLALEHEKGSAEQASMTQAVILYKAAALQGHARAQSSLGRLYLTGKGVEADLVRAHVWIVLGIRGGSTLFSGNLQRAEARMSPEQRDAAARLLDECTVSMPLTCP